MVFPRKQKVMPTTQRDFTVGQLPRWQPPSSLSWKHSLQVSPMKSSEYNRLYMARMSPMERVKKSLSSTKNSEIAEKPPTRELRALPHSTSKPAAVVLGTASHSTVQTGKLVDFPMFFDRSTGLSPLLTPRETEKDQRPDVTEEDLHEWLSCLPEVEMYSPNLLSFGPPSNEREVGDSSLVEVVETQPNRTTPAVPSRRSKKKSSHELSQQTIDISSSIGKQSFISAQKFPATASKPTTVPGFSTEQPSTAQSRKALENEDTRLDNVLKDTTNTKCRKRKEFDKKTTQKSLHGRACSCRKSRCLKLYCECFAASLICDPYRCKCNDCHNNSSDNKERQQAIKVALERDNNAFSIRRPNRKQRRASLLRADEKIAREGKGCRCQKSFCLKKYCECFFTSSTCSRACACSGCKNPFGIIAKDSS